jgi:hypothetical protein
MTYTQLQQVLRSFWPKADKAPILDGAAFAAGVLESMSQDGDVLQVGRIAFRETPIGWVTITPITRAEWRAYEPAPTEWKRTWVNESWEDNLPATDLTLKQIEAFIDNINFSLPGTGLPGECRLPTLGEALTMALAVEDVSLPVNDYGTFSWQPWMQPVGFSMANAWGLWDTLGCVWQWCADGPEGMDVVQPTGTVYTYKRRFASGGSWKYSAKECLPEAFGGRGYFAIAMDERIQGRDLGFRLIVPKAGADELTVDARQVDE